jgi:hypothetical protein
VASPADKRERRSIVEHSGLDDEYNVSGSS